MKLILRARGGGKTTAACEWLMAKPTERIMVVMNWKIKQDLIRGKGMPKDRVFTVDEIREQTSLRGMKCPEILVDDADYILRQYLQTHVDVATMTAELEKRLSPRSRRGK